MSTSQQRLGGAMRLAVLFRDAANLNLQLSELKRLRDQVNQAQLSGQKSRSTNHRKRTARCATISDDARHRRSRLCATVPATRDTSIECTDDVSRAREVRSASAEPGRYSIDLGYGVARGGIGQPRHQVSVKTAPSNAVGSNSRHSA